MVTVRPRAILTTETETETLRVTVKPEDEDEDSECVTAEPLLKPTCRGVGGEGE